MLPILLFFGLCFFGMGDCGETEYHQALEELRLSIIINNLDVTLNDYVGNGCLQTKFENPMTYYGHNDNGGRPNNYGKVIQSQGWHDGNLWHNLNGTILTETFCSNSVLVVFEKDGNFVDLDYGNAYYDGEWIRYNSTQQSLESGSGKQ